MLNVIVDFKVSIAVCDWICAWILLFYGLAFNWRFKSILKW